MSRPPASASDPRLTIGLASLSLALLGGCALLAWKLAHSGTVFYGEEALRNPDIQREVIRKLTEGNVSPFDSHPDAEVGRILAPNGSRGEFRTNDIGMRERPFELEKPPGVVRVLLLGDSYVFGLNIPEVERLGAVLEGFLHERAAEPKPRFECLHFAVNSWNIVAECAFLRRQIDRLRPDLVIQLTYSNDLDDVPGVRGFGAESNFAPRNPQRADGILLSRYPSVFLQQDTRNYLQRGLDHESRQRFGEALEAIQELRALMARLAWKPRHLFLVHWGVFAPALHAHLGSRIDSDLFYLPLELSTDKSLWITPTDAHWNGKGHAQVAEFLYGLIRTQGLLPGVDLAPWPAAEERAEDWTQRGRESATTGFEPMKRLVKDPVSAIDFPELTLQEARQVHGGLDLQGYVSPYLSLVLKRVPEAKELRVRGRALPDEVLRGAHLRFFLEELEVAEVTLAPDQPIELRFPLPPTLDGREYLNLRCEADDYAYRGHDLRRCVAFQLERAALE